ncbi:hypothetical protein O4159_18035 [Gordonia terrae]|nr:hypothetical protein [Gordonia terrae]
MYSLRELTAMGWAPDAIAQARKAETLTSLRYGWVRTSAADPHVVSAVTAGGALSCISALRFHQRRGLPDLWIPPGHNETHVRLSKHAKSATKPSGPFRWCQGFGRPLPVTTAVDPIAVAVGCAARCLPAEEWIAVVDSVLNATD